MKDTQCVLAYTSIYVEPDGEVRPCCISAPFEKKLYWNDYPTINELFNAEQFKEIRKQMDEGITPRMCDVCFKQGNTLKNDWNKMWGHKLTDITLVNGDYSVNRLEYVDVRFSNLCNFKCRMCGPTLSSSWYDDLVEIYGEGISNKFQKTLKIGIDPVDKFTDDDLKDVKHLYLAGGEPFINEDVFKFLDRFDERLAKNINMYINTNLSTLKYKDRDVLEVLSKFKYVTIGCSCDGYGSVGEYQRTGFNSDKFFNNLSKIVEYRKTHDNIKPEIEFTITMMNVFHIFDFIEYVTSNGYLDEEYIHFHWATTPPHYSVGASPLDFKEKVLKYVDDNLENGKYSVKLRENLANFKDFVNIDASIIKEGQNKVDLRSLLMRLDIMRNTNYKDICPWIEVMF